MEDKKDVFFKKTKTKCIKYNCQSYFLFFIVLINLIIFCICFLSDKFVKYLLCFDLKSCKSFVNKISFDSTLKICSQNNLSYGNFNVYSFKQIKNSIHNLNVKIKNLLTFNNKLEYKVKIISKSLMELKYNFSNLSKKIDKIYNCSCENLNVKNIFILNTSHIVHNEEIDKKIRKKIDNRNISNPWKLNENTNEVVIVIDP